MNIEHCTFLYFRHIVTNKVTTNLGVLLWIFELDIWNL
jgi:hypothetical protein